jgi:hypothetical protein
MVDPPNNEATTAIKALKQTVGSFIEEYNLSFIKKDHTYLYRSLEVEDPFPHFYITAKVHKTPWKTRPIKSMSGSILHGLGKWVNHQLQPDQPISRAPSIGRPNSLLSPSMPNESHFYRRRSLDVHQYQY